MTTNVEKALSSELKIAQAKEAKLIEENEQLRNQLTEIHDHFRDCVGMLRSAVTMDDVVSVIQLMQTTVKKG